MKQEAKRETGIVEIQSYVKRQLYIKELIKRDKNGLFRNVRSCNWFLMERN